MKKERPRLITSEFNNKNPILIIDKKGIIGTYLANRLKEQFLVVLVSGRQLSYHNNIIHIPYRRKVPVVPDNSYSHYFIFYNGESELFDMLPSFVNKANSTKGKVFFLTPLEYSSSALFKKLSNHTYYHMKNIVYGEVFDGGTRIVNMVNYLIHSARTYGRVILPNEGISKIYPVWIEDLLAVIIASAFSEENPVKLMHVFPKTPFTEITVARILQKINPNLKIDFNRRKTKTLNYFISPEGTNMFSSYDLEIGLRKVVTHDPDVDLSNLGKDLTYKPAREDTNMQKFLNIVLAVLALPIVFAIITSILGFGLMPLALSSGEQGHFGAAKSYANVAHMSLSSAESVSASYLPLKILARRTHSRLVQSLTNAKDAAEIEKDIFGSVDIFSKVYHGESKNPEKDFSQALTTTKNSLIKLEEMKAQNQLPEAIVKKIESVGFLLSTFENTIDSYPQILGFDRPRKYLLLFQNNMELRPGGGFIGSYATLEMDKGHADKIEINDVYDADGKLKTHIEPPYGLKRYGGVSHWFLRDSNFDVNTLSNAAASASIFKAESGLAVDGVISIDTNFIKNLLEATGPIMVDDYKEQVNAQNFYMLTQKHAEDNFFPGSTQKKDFLRSLMSALIIRLNDKEKVSYLRVLKQIEKSIKEKHLLFVFEDKSVQKAFSVNNLSGVIIDSRSSERNTLNDYFGTVDANIGANKSNYYLKRSISQDVAISDIGGLSVIANVDYENTSKPGDKFGGEYKNYVRFILPPHANLTGVTIDGKDRGIIPAITNSASYLSKTFVAPEEVEIETVQSNGKEVVGFYVTVPSGAHRKVSISYTVPQGIDTASSEFFYSQRIIKQPGTGEDPYTLTLSYPAKFMPNGTGKEFVDLGGKVRYETKLNTDKDIRLKFSQK